MKTLFVSDSQLGATTVALADQEEVWDRIVSVAIDRQVDSVTHAGDLLEGPVVSPEHLLAFRRPLARLREAGIPMLIVRGNHDGAVRPVDALDVFHEYDGLFISQTPAVHIIGGLAICTLPWVHRGRLLATSGGDHENINEAVATLLAEIAQDLATEALWQYPDFPRVLVAHWSVSTAALPSGMSAEQMNEPVLPWADLDAIGYDLIVAGHIHAAQRLDNQQIDRTPGFVVGSPQQLNHGEHGEHGVWVVDFGAGVPERSPRAGREGADSSEAFARARADGSAPSIEFVPIPSRKFVMFSYDFTEDADLSYFVEESDWGGADDPPVAGAIVRVRYQATEEQARQIDQARIRRALMDAGAAQVTFQPEIVRQTRARSERMTDQLGPVEALAAYCDAQGLGDPLRTRMLSRLEDWIAA